MRGKSYSMGEKYNPVSSKKGTTLQSVNKLGVIHLSYRGQQYLLKDRAINMNIVRKPGVPGYWESSTQYTNGVMNLNLLDKDFTPMNIMMLASA